MTNFAYKALDARGAQATGEIEGDSKAAVAAALRNQGLTVLDLNEVKQGWGQIQIGGRIKPKDLTVFSRQFATMVNSGLSMLRCLYVLEEQTPNKKLAAVISADPRRRRGRHQPLGRAREAPQGLQPALREHGPGRRARRHPRRGAQPPRHAAREGRQHPPRRQVGDGLPDPHRLASPSSCSSAWCCSSSRSSPTCTRTSATPSCRCSRASWWASRTPSCRSR